VTEDSPRKDGTACPRYCGVRRPSQGGRDAWRGVAHVEKFPLAPPAAAFRDYE